MKLRCRLFGHTFVDNFKYRKCLTCGLVQKKVLTPLHRELDENAKTILLMEAELLLLMAEKENDI